MKKYITLGLTLLLSLLIISGCGNKNIINLSSEKEIRINDFKIQPKEAEIKDDNLIVTLDWSFGNNDDSMKKQKFIQSGILFFAEQDGENLASDIKDANMYTETYETNKSTIRPSFKLKNKNNTVKITLSKDGNTSATESFEINLKK
ncbi:hypothetical protein BG261_05565 [Floricoccus tropicus]|uniref:DUF5067 domain-containing protein n=1 Tax=Floricoccus tropicus TaxID=1859473 RepID=A0A1E8GLI5_9LACT|nr:hypothetical protein [Floricoccus tropicus]OFI48856.1 hypothetical protein BG261_05565 [Floricoccus tropicus]